jgi:stage V sporulation protein B
MCLVSYGLYRMILTSGCDERLAVIPAIIVAVPVYGLALILAKGVTEKELRSLPGGRIITRILKKVHLI